MHTKYKLSICIPTYNRAKYLPELLDSILSQSESNLVEIAISDNASTDNTEELIKAYQERHENIVYLKLDENLGPDRNYFKAVENSSGEYAWLMGSDDKLAEGALALVLHEIESGKDIYLQDRIDCDINMNVIKRRLWWRPDTKENWDFSVDKLEDYFSTCTSLGGVFSFLSSIVVKKSKWNNHFPPAEYFETAYSHVYTLLSILKNNGSMKLLNSGVVLSRGGNDHFAAEGLCKRRLIDFLGYTALSRDLKFNTLSNILRSEHSVKSISAMFLGCASNSKVFSLLKSSSFSMFSIYTGLFISLVRRFIFSNK